MNESALESCGGAQKVNLKEVEMRVISILVASAALASCTTAPPQPFRAADKQREYVQLLNGKVPQPPRSCLPHSSSGDMRVIDDNTILFRDGASRVYVSNMRNGCNGLANGQNALVTRQYGSADLCSGDIARVVDTTNGMFVGSCSFGEFTPYVKPKA